MLTKEENPIWPALYNPETAFSFIALRDHAEVASKVINEREKHFFATYSLSNFMPMKYTEIAESVSEAIGKEI